MARRTIHMQEATARIVRHAFPDTPLSDVVERGIQRLLADLPIADANRAFRATAAELEAELRERAGVADDRHSRKVKP